MATVQNIGVRPVQTAETVFIAPRRAAAIDHRMDRGVNACPIIGVNLGNPPFARGVQRGKRVAISLFQRVIPEHVVGGKIPVPYRIVGRFGG